MNIYIIGYGYLGHALTKIPHNFTLIDKKKPIRINSADYNALYNLMEKNTPDVVIHTAANKYIDKCEKDLKGSFEDNLISTYNLVRLKEIFGFKLVFVSTDKAVNPKSVYGYEKLLCERIVTEAGGVVVRLVNIINSTGSIIPKWVELANNGKPIEVYGKNTFRYMMTVENAVDIIYKAIDYSGRIVVPKPDRFQNVNIYNLAKSITDNIILKELNYFEKENEELTWQNENVVLL